MVLVHGAYRGAWSWSRLTPLLAERGYRIHVVELSGLGSSAQASHPGIGLRTHIDQVADTLSHLGTDLILVGASYGGLVITGVAARLHNWVRGLIYLDAAVPEPGDSMIQMFDRERRLEIIETAVHHGDGWRLPGGRTANFAILAESDAEYIRRHLCDQPLLTFLQTVEFDESLLSEIPRVFVRCVSGSAATSSPVSRSGERVRRLPGWRFIEIEGDHDSMVTNPGLVAAVLDQCTKSMNPG